MLNQDKLRLIFGLKIAYLRQQKGYSYMQLAELTDLSQSYVHEIEKGKKYPKADKILALAKALDTTYDDLVSVNASKRLQPIIDLLASEFFQVFPLDMFGISPDKVMELFSNTPDRINAFISTIIKIARNYQVQTENFYTAALRSYQDMHDNYFVEIEQAAQACKRDFNIAVADAFPTSDLAQILQVGFNIGINRKKMGKEKSLRHIRSFFAENAVARTSFSPQNSFAQRMPLEGGEREREGEATLFINKGLTTAQENFLIAREIGFHYLKLKERPFETVIQKAESFEKLFNNFKASYFASALLMDETTLAADIRDWANGATWKPDSFIALFNKYNVTPEMLLQRLTNVLPKEFKINNLFFLRLHADEAMKSFKMNKELHLSRIHQPYANELNEHYCRRWVSVKAMKQLRTLQQLDKAAAFVCDAQISKYWETDLSYFVLTVAKPNSMNPKESISVTIGILLDENARRLFRFLDDPNLSTVVVNTTCERCSMLECSERAVAPAVIERQNEAKETERALAKLRVLND